jgi:uncharacterized protein (DUF58 family)
LILTKRFWWLLALGIPIAAFTTWIGTPLLGVAYDLCLFAVAYATTRMTPPVSEFRIRRKFDPVLSVRAQNKIVLQLENEGDATISGLLRDEPPAHFEASRREFRFRVEPGETEELTYTLVPPERGSEKFRATFLRLDCPLGLATRQIELDSSEPVRVYPNVLALREFDLLKQQGRLREVGIRRSRAKGLGSEFESLRDYAEGDDYRKIDWKASARRGRLVTRQFEQERNQAVMLCIDVGRHMLAEANGVRKLDHVLDALLMLTNAAAIAGDFVGALVFSDTVKRYIPPRKGRGQVGAIIEAIHDLVAEPLESDTGGAFAFLGSRWKRRSLMVLFTDYDNEDRAREIATAFGPMARRHLALVVRVQDPKLDEVLRSGTPNLDEMYLKAAAGLLLEDRRTASQVISSAGINALDSEPQQLASKLVTFYFSVKERALL